MSHSLPPTPGSRADDAIPYQGCQSRALISISFETEEFVMRTEPFEGFCFGDSPIKRDYNKRRNFDHKGAVA
jgi:hypothetical protein